MSEVKAQYNQVLIDIAMQEYGDPVKVLELAIANERSITDELASGSSVVVNLQEITAAQRKVALKLKKPINTPASGDANYAEESLGGLEIWAIEADFEIQEG